MSSPTKRQKLETATTTGFSHPCLQFLPQGDGERPFRIENSETVGTYVTAARRLEPGSLLFKMKSDYLITYKTVSSTPLSQIILSLPDISISPEELVWLNMIAWLNDKDENNPRRIFLQALSKVPPNASSWPTFLQEQLKGSNAYSVLDSSGANDDTPGNVSAVKNLLNLLGDIRASIQTKRPNSKNDADDEALSKATEILVENPASSIFTEESISWARGHFLSRRFPDLQPKIDAFAQHQDQGEGDSLKDLVAKATAARATSAPLQHLNGYGGKLSTLIPILDLMNHRFDKASTCTLEVTASGVEMRTGETTVEKGQELFYCYGDKSNEVLLQGYGFCVSDNENDTITLKLRTDETGTTSKTFSIGRGGAEAIPVELWCAIAGVDPQREGADQALEIGSGDLERLLHFLKSKLDTLQAHPLMKREVIDEMDLSPDDKSLCHARLSFIQIYKTGQREILEELIRDISSMLGDA